MARLFVTQREMDLFSDLTKEVIKDVVGQKIYYFPISILKSDSHDLYEEAVNKVFENPIEIECLVQWMPEEVRTNQFGTENFYSIEVYVHYRDMLDKGIDIAEGDFFSYGSIFFEITSAIFISNIYGQVEYKTGIKLVGKQARKSQILAPTFGPTSEGSSDPGAVQEEFAQQRGHDTNKHGETNDKRALIEKDVLEKPITGPKEVSKKGRKGSKSNSSSFYND